MATFDSQDLNFFVYFRFHEVQTVPGQQTAQTLDSKRGQMRDKMKRLWRKFSSPEIRHGNVDHPPFRQHRSYHGNHLGRI